jgi:hypothetical protein
MLASHYPVLADRIHKFVCVFDTTPPRWEFAEESQRTSSAYTPPPPGSHSYDAYPFGPSDANPAFARTYHSNAAQAQRQERFPVHPSATSNPYHASAHTFSFRV